MAFNDTAVSSDELTALGRDYPLFVGNNVLELTSTQLPEWRSSGNWSTGADRTISGMPGRLAYDRNGKVRTMPEQGGGGVVADISLIFQIIATSGASSVGAFDVAAVLGHNLDQVTGLSHVYLEISDSSDFSSPTTLVTWDPPYTKARLVSLSLATGSGSNRRIDNAVYIRLRFVNSGNFGTFPAIGELWLGRRQQLTMFGNLDYPVSPVVSQVTDLVSDSGNVSRHTNFMGRGDRTIAFTTGGTTIGSIDQNACFDTLRDHTSYFTRPFLFVEKPSSASSVVHMMQLPDASYVRMARGPAEHDVELAMVECPRFVLEER